MSNFERNGCLTAIMGLFGVILLLPGLCVLLLSGKSIASGKLDSQRAIPEMFLAILVVVLGVMLIRAGIRGSRP
jgi:hypothetical protein